MNIEVLDKLPRHKGTKGQLPDGWRWVRLGDVCEMVGGMQPPKSTFKYEPLSGYVRLVQIQDFRRSDVAVYIPAKEAKRAFDESDVMIGRYGPPLFQILRGLSGAYNVALMKTIPKASLLKDYLYYLLQEPSIQSAVISQSQRSAGQTGVQKEFLESLLVPLPPLTEQKRIAAILNEQMEAVERSRIATSAQLDAVKALPAAYLRAVFNSPDAQQWQRKRLRDMCELVGGMQPPKSAFKYEPLPGYVRLVQIQDFRRSDVAVYISKEEAKRAFDESDVMIGRYGPPIFQILRGLSGAYNVALIKAVPKAGLLKDYLYYLLQEPTIQDAVIAQSQRSAGQSGVQKTFLEKLLVPIPSPLEQQHLAARIAEKMTSTKQLHQTLKEQLDAINQLPATLLRRAFNGEL